MSNQPKLLLSLSEAAELLSLNKQQLYELTRTRSRIRQMIFGGGNRSYLLFSGALSAPRNDTSHSLTSRSSVPVVAKIPPSGEKASW